MGEKKTSFRALCEAYEAASEATRAEFLQWLDRGRVPSPWPAADAPLPWGGSPPAGESFAPKKKRKRHKRESNAQH